MLACGICFALTHDMSIRIDKEADMKCSIGVLVAALSLAAAGQAHAQETVPGPGALEVTVIPGGGTFFTSGDKGPSFGDYNLGGAITYNVNRLVGIEGEVGGSIGIAQDLQVGGVSSNQKTPNLLGYTANLVVAAPTRTWSCPTSRAASAA